MVEETKGAKKKIGAVRSSAIGETPFVETIPQIFCPLALPLTRFQGTRIPSDEGKYLGLIRAMRF